MELVEYSNKSEELTFLQDVELVNFILDGNESAFEELVRRYHRPLTMYIHGMIGDYEISLDITQEVFLKVYNCISQYSSVYRFSTWLYRIAHNAAVDYLRRHKRFEQSLDEDSEKFTIAEPVSKSLSPEMESESREWVKEIEKVIMCLPAIYRELIILRHTQDLSYEEIAEVTGLPLGTVKNRLFRAREMMKQMLIKRGFIRD
jgi:RNA polymerase sigma-70 factor (ECF subfamily)